MKNANSKERKSFLKDIGWLFGGGSVRSVLAALETVLLARGLGLELLGVFSIVVAYIKILNAFLDLRVWEGVVKYVGEHWEKGESKKAKSAIKLFYFVDVTSGVVAFVISILLAGVANKYLIKHPDGSTYVIIYSFSLLVSTVNTTSDALLRVFKRFREIAFAGSFEVFIRVISVFIVLVLGFSVKGVLICYVFANILGFIVRQIIVNRILIANGLSGWLYVRFNLIRGKMAEIFWFLLNTSIMGTLKMANENHLAILALGHFSGKDAAGLYRIARTVVKIMVRFVDPVYEAIYPRLVTIATARSLEDFKELVKYSSYTLMKVLIPLAVGIVVLAEYIIEFFFGKQYVPAADTMRILAIAVVINHLTFWVNPALLAVGKPGERTALEAMRSVIYVLALFFLVREFSLVGAGFAFLIGALFKFFASVYLYQTSIKEALVENLTTRT